MENHRNLKSGAEYILLLKNSFNQLNLRIKLKSAKITFHTSYTKEMIYPLGVATVLTERNAIYGRNICCLKRICTNSQLLSIDPSLTNSTRRDRLRD